MKLLSIALELQISMFDLTLNNESVKALAVKVNDLSDIEHTVLHRFNSLAENTFAKLSNLEPRTIDVIPADIDTRVISSEILIYWTAHSIDYRLPA